MSYHFNPSDWLGGRKHGVGPTTQVVPIGGIVITSVGGGV